MADDLQLESLTYGSSATELDVDDSCIEVVSVRPGVLCVQQPEVVALAVSEDKSSTHDPSTSSGVRSSRQPSKLRTPELRQRPL